MLHCLLGCRPAACPPARRLQACPGVLQNLPNCCRPCFLLAAWLPTLLPSFVLPGFLPLQVDKDLRQMLIRPDAPKPRKVAVRVWPKAIPQVSYWPHWQHPGSPAIQPTKPTSCQQ